ncbi:MAG: energy transducer TonB [Aureispira sp.]
MKHIYLVALWSVTFFCYTPLIHAQKKSSSSTKKKLRPNKDGVYTLAEEMPRFPGCKQMKGSAKEKKRCADLRLLKFIYKNVKYPSAALEASQEGMALVRFTVTKKGKIEDIELLRDPGYELGKEAVRVVGLMTEMKAGWTPGRYRRKSVAVQYTLPIRFKLSGKEETKT